MGGGCLEGWCQDGVCGRWLKGGGEGTYLLAVVLETGHIRAGQETSSVHLGPGRRGGQSIVIRHRGRLVEGCS